MSKYIGIFATEISSRVQADLYQELHARAIERGYNLFFFSANLMRLSDTTDPNVFELFEIAENVDCAAYIIHAQSLRNTMLIDKMIEIGHRKNIPVIAYDCENYGYTKERGIITINPDYSLGFENGIKHLIEHHHSKEIYMLAGQRNNKYSDERIEAYKRQLIAHGMEYREDHVLYGDFWEVPAMDAVNALLDSDLPKPDAICSANDSMAIAAIRVLKLRGYEVPGDVLVTGFDGIEDGKFNDPQISTCEPILEDVPDIVFDAIKNDTRTGEHKVSFRFIAKESCNCENENQLSDRQEIARLVENARQTSWQHSLLANMQLELMDSCELEDADSHMVEVLKLYKGFSQLYCVRDQIEYQYDLARPLEKMRISLNKDFMSLVGEESFQVDDIVPGGISFFDNAKKEEMFIFRLLQSGSKTYGYSITKTEQFRENEIKIFGQIEENYCNTIESILRNMRLDQANKKLSEMYDRMSEVFIRDTMTGLYNRHGYYQKLDEYMTRTDLKEGYIHLIAIDMDGMKAINDNFGHQEGDNAIKAVSKTINDCFAQPCVCARFGGDEFMVALFTSNGEKPSAETISTRLNNYLGALVDSKKCGYSVGVSVGHAVGRVNEIVDMNLFEKQADEKMYGDKRQRKGN
ncbi:MAG: GGDEF domain-containing protein [Lachnospiraceae bacterium]|nr:GGDEF domain-containing protein [Candidatus Merdinaster equi]